MSKNRAKDHVPVTVCSMTKEEAVKVEGKVLKNMSHGLYKVELENGHEVLGHLSGKMRKHSISIIPGDIVTMELSPYDLTRGRIMYRLK